MIRNSKGTVYYGLHFYPGVAEYQEPGKDAFRVFLNEDTLRAMDPSFAGRPVFVHHVDGVDEDVDTLRGEADGWVIESFFNAADGKHWVKFLVVSEKGERAIKQGMQLSNCYVPKDYGPGGLWNGVSYQKEITAGEYEHLAIVPNPRYEESFILTPEKFKAYNDEKTQELKRLANKGKGMKINFFKRAKVENAVDLTEMSVVLPKSGREVTIVALVEAADADAVRVKNGEAPELDPKSIVTVKNGEKMTVGDLVAKHQAMCDELDAFKKKNVEGDDGGDADHEMENADGDGDSDDMQNDDMDGDGDDKKKKKENDDAEQKAADEKKKNDLADAKRKAKEKADRLRNADRRAHDSDEVARVEFSDTQVARGKARYGS